MAVSNSTGQANLAGGATTTAPQSVAAGRFDKLTICNQALINTANRPCVVPDDGTDEWVITSSAFDQWLDSAWTSGPGTGRPC